MIVRIISLSPQDAYLRAGFGPCIIGKLMHKRADSHYSFILEDDYLVDEGEQKEHVYLLTGQKWSGFKEEVIEL